MYSALYSDNLSKNEHHDMDGHQNRMEKMSEETIKTGHYLHINVMNDNDQLYYTNES
jgi:hypothetical protein